MTKKEERDKLICELMKLSTAEIADLIIKLKNIKDYCEECGCNEFLCGHNKKE